ncbi:MAG: hypothetical protein ABIP63_03615 [Thermoanaerobaculia bacterium]
MKSNALRVSTILLALVLLMPSVPAFATPPTPSPDATLIRQQIESLFFQTRDIAFASGLNQGERVSLLTKLIEARSAIIRGNDEAAANLLGAFINEVNALVQSGRLSPTDAAILSSKASSIIAQIGA